MIVDSTIGQIAVAVFFGSVVIASILRARREVTGTWAMMRERFGTDPDDFNGTIGPRSIKGKLKVSDETYIGSVSAHPVGVVFRRETWNGFELLLIPWSTFSGSANSSGNQDWLRASIPMPVGAPLTIELSWSQRLAELMAKIQTSS